MDYLYDDTSFFEDAKPIEHCEFCGSSLYVGDNTLHLKSDDTYYCDTECLFYDLDIQEVEL